MGNIAHITQDGRMHTVDKHLKSVAEYCEINAAKIGLGACGKLSGRLHDIGKFDDGFTEYIKIVNANPDYKQKGPDHAFVGAVYVNELAKKFKSSLSSLTAQIISIVVMWHHGGLKDIRDFEDNSLYLKRLEKVNDPKWEKVYENSLAEFHTYFFHEDMVALFEKATAEIYQLLEKIKICTKSANERFFFFGLLCKYLYSCLIDADWHNTAEFKDGKEIEYPKSNKNIWDTFSERFEEKYRDLSKNSSSEINKLRTVLSDNCLQSAELRPGIYALNCPTGAGKTLSSLRYALNHAKTFNKDRIFYIIPLISIIEQNSKVIKEFLEEDENILELHSAVEPEGSLLNNSSNNINSREDRPTNDYELLTERMDAPIVITTMVRFLNTFFKGNARSSRAIHNFADSIIIFDEIQTIPVKCIGMFNSLINFLVYICGATVVLSTATQITLDSKHGMENPLIGISNNEISNCTKEIRDKFIRVDFDMSMLYKENSKESNETNICMNSRGEIVERIKTESFENSSILCVFNTKKSTESIYDELINMQASGELDETIRIYYLTTSLCPVHRSERVVEIKKALEEGRRIIVVSTQLIEAGVDVSFDVVFRSLAGIDSIIQAAGRCNRNGNRASRGKVILISPDFENLDHLNAIRQGKISTEKVLSSFKKSPDKYDNRCDSQKAINEYFNNYLEKMSVVLKYPIKAEGKKDNINIYDLLAQNGCKKPTKTMLNQAFETAGKHFEVIDSIGIPAVVPYKEGIELISDALSSCKLYSKKDFLRKLQKYTINISLNNENEINEYAIFNEELGVYFLKDGYYDREKGFVRERHLDTLLI